MNSARPFRQRKADRLITPGATAEQIRCDFACAPMDRLAGEMEATWGVDRLPALVSPGLAEKYARAIAHLHAMLDAADPAGTVAAVENCIKGLRAMDAEARAAGHVPPTPEIWEVHIEGRRIGLIRDADLWRQAEALRPDLTIYTARQAAVALCPDITAPPPMPPPAPLRTALEAELDDEIPF